MVADGYCKKCGAIADVTPVESGALLCDDCLDGNVTVAAAAFKLIDKFESQGGIKYSQAGDRNPENGSTDCSGWVCYLSKSQGVEIPNTTGPMYKHFEKKDQLHDTIEPSDVIFWPGHAGMYMGVLHVKLDDAVAEKMGLNKETIEKQAQKDITVMDKEVQKHASSKDKMAWKNFRALLKGTERYYYKDGSFHYVGPVISEASSGVKKAANTPIRYFHSNRFKGTKPFGRIRKPKK
jgi:hypothetical protein